MLEEWHQEEERARKQLEKINPNNPALKYLYSSTYEACKAYWKAIMDERVTVVSKVGKEEQK